MNKVYFILLFIFVISSTLLANVINILAEFPSDPNSTVSDIDAFYYNQSSTDSLPDLIISTIEIAYNSDNSLWYYYVISNVGDGVVYLDGPTDEAYDNVSIQSFFSADTTFDSSDLPAGGSIIGESPLGELAPGESFYGNWYTSRNNSPTETPYLLLIVDYQNAVIESEEENNTKAVLIDPQVSPPDIPTDVNASDGIYSDRIHISWNSVQDVSGYNVYRSTANNDPLPTQISFTSFTSIDDSSTDSGVFYYYLRAVKFVAGNRILSSLSISDAGWLQAINNELIPILLSPAEGDTLDNGRIDRQDIMTWEFDWSDVEGASNYQLYVKHIDAPNPFIDEEGIINSFYVMSAVDAYTSNLTGWEWKVRAKVNDNWEEWSQTRSFFVEPPNTDTATDIEDVKNIPTKFELSQNYPNPFNPVTKIQYSVSQKSKVLIIVYDVLGKTVKILVEEEKSAGKYSVDFDCSNLPSGIYFYQMKANDFSKTKKMVLLQ